jgi:tRNA A64-2'-O-ribosylphosphate transferase
MILIDSTRSGKRMPDALSKTVPMWCAVINRALLIRYPDLKSNELSPWDTRLYVPPAVVSVQEHHQIEQRLDNWAKALAVNLLCRLVQNNFLTHIIQASTFSLPRLPRHLRPVWFTPATTTFPTFNQLSNLGEFIPVLCVSASKHVDQGIERRPNGYSYVQGSGDDHELWGMVVAVTIPVFLTVLFIDTRA